jgi:hypothetical protein
MKLTTLFSSVRQAASEALHAVADYSAYLIYSAELRPAMADLGCLFPSLECIRLSKAMVLDGYRAKDTRYWDQVSSLRAAQEKERAKKEKAKKLQLQQEHELAELRRLRWIYENEPRTTINNHHTTNVININSAFFGIAARTTCDTPELPLPSRLPGIDPPKPPPYLLRERNTTEYAGVGEAEIENWAFSLILLVFFCILYSI